MILFLYGQDQYRAMRRQQTIVSDFLKDNPLSTHIALDIEAQGKDLNTQFKTVGLFDTKNLYTVTTDSTTITKLCLIMRDNTVIQSASHYLLIRHHGSLNDLKKTAPELHQKILKNMIPSEEHSYLSTTELEHWATQELRSYGCTIEPATLRYIISSVTPIDQKNKKNSPIDMWLLAMELIKISNYARALGTLHITDQHKASMPTPQNQSIFTFLDALGNRTIPQSAMLLQRQLENNIDPHYLVSMIAFHLRNLLSIKDLVNRATPPTDIARITKLHPYVIQKTQLQAKQFTLQELKDMFNRIVGYEIASKDGEITMHDALYDLVLGM